MNKRVTKKVEVLRDGVLNAPHPALIYAANYLIGEFDRADLPDWVAALAYGNPAVFEELLDEVRGEMAVEESETAVETAIAAIENDEWLTAKEGEDDDDR